MGPSMPCRPTSLTSSAFDAALGGRVRSRHEIHTALGVEPHGAVRAALRRKRPADTAERTRPESPLDK